MISLPGMPVPVFDVRITVPETVLRMSAPSKADYFRMTVPADPPALAGELAEKYGQAEAPPFLQTSALLFIADYFKKINEYREKNMDIMKMPEQLNFGKENENKNIAFPVCSFSEKLVFEHSGINFIEQNELPITEYWILLADAAKIRILQGKDGAEYLSQCYKDMHRISDF